MPRLIAVGVIGYGLAGRVFHTPFLQANAEFSLEMIATGNPERQAQARSRYADVAIVASAQDLLSQASDLDLVVLATPAHTHRALGLAAFAAGAALVVDKPFAASSADAAALIDASNATGLPLTVFQNRRLDGDFLTVKDIVSSGALGRVHRFESTFERWSPQRKDRWQDQMTASDGAGITFDLGSHLIDQALQLFGPVADVHAELGLVRDGAVSDDDAFLSLLHESGVRSHLTMSSIAAQSGPRFRVLGAAGAYSVYGLDGQEAALDAGMLPTDTSYNVTPEHGWGTLATGTVHRRVPTLRGDYATFYSGVAAMVRGEAQAPVNPLESLEVVRIIERAIAPRRKRPTVHVQYEGAAIVTAIAGLSGRAAPSELLRHTPVIAVLRAAHARDYDRVVDVLHENGIHSIELTLSTPGTLECLPDLAARKHTDLEIGVGTIVSVQQAQQAIDCGADYLVTPTMNLEIIALALRNGIPIYPGGLSPTELFSGWQAGASAVKIFPAETVGPQFGSHLRGPFPDLEFVPSGGIRLEDIPAWFKAGATAVSLGGPLLGDALKGGSLSALAERVTSVVDLVAQSGDSR